ncbi:site-specific integrase [Coleofasciculus sp. FACHB-542]|uniref:site-specific integrase n=1 Tax=Coleofasciculus sp. FACHB-542 TaxID=2692787 RepID=UPI0016844734|nr:site-specific integrase [Coleofasciculus sp. FACHB-542]MBD2085076.1 tyrosine-type recombinase/integrase [Coleofasciculus sp. FACHB-542]
MNTTQKASKGSVGIESFQERLRLRLPRQLYGGKQKYLTLGLSDTPENRKAAEGKARQVELDILAGYFDPTLAKYKPQTHLTLLNPSEESQKPLALAELWDRYTEFKSTQLEKTTILRDYGKIQKRIQKLPTQDLSKGVEIRDSLLKAYSPEVTKRTLKQFNACCNWAVRSKLISSNPFDGMAAEIISKTASSRSRMSFTKEERDAIITAFEDNTYSSKFSPVSHSYYAAYVKFLFLTGCRPEEAIALKWKHIQNNRIVFCEAVATDLKIRKSTKTHVIRTLPINTQLQYLLDEIKPEEVSPEALVLPAKNGKELDAHNFLNRVWKPVVQNLVKAAKVKQYLPQYHTRHTFITMALEAGVSVVQVSKWVGNSPEIIMKHYAGTIRQVQVPEF